MLREPGSAAAARCSSCMAAAWLPEVNRSRPRVYHSYTSPLGSIHDLDPPAQSPTRPAPRAAPGAGRPARTVAYMPIVNDDLPFGLPWAEGRTPAEFSAQAFGSGSAGPGERAAGLVMGPFRG